MAKTPANVPLVTVRRRSQMQAPGPLKSQNDLATLHTRQAQRLVEGRAGPRPVVGLLMFAARVGEMCQAIREDDPYADWILLRVERELDKAKSLLAEKDAQLNRMLGETDGVSIGLAESSEPTRIQINFGNAYGYQGVFLLRDYDNLVRTALTLGHCGLLERARVAEILNACGGAVRRAFQEAMAWRRTGVTRDDVKKNAESAQAATQSMGELPDYALAWERRARFAPAPRSGEIAKDGTNP
jgi:integrating conjugative element protein (TIGR03761 family)